jgi:hypothetical protein
VAIRTASGFELKAGNVHRTRWLRSVATALRSAVAVSCALVLVAGCGNSITTEINGAVAAKMDATHSVVLVFRVCSGAVDHVELYPPHAGPRTKSDRPIGVWRTSTPIARNTILNLGHPGPTWQVRRDPGHLQPGLTYGVLAMNSGVDEELTQLNFRPSQLEALPSGHVRFDRRVLREEGFAELAWCSWS